MLEYEVFGSSTDPTALLIMGMGAQLTRWPIPFCEKIAASGYQVIRFDNRDMGRSSWIDTPMQEMWEMMASLLMGGAFKVPYTLSDLGNDTLGLMDALHIPAAHIIGLSMGGMIGQLLAADHPQRTLSLVSMMSTSGNPALPRASAEIFAKVTARPPSGIDVDKEMAAVLLTDAMIALAGPTYPLDMESARQRVLADLDRGYNPAGITRQFAAITASGDRREKLRSIQIPTLVLHGELDPLFPVAAAHDTAACIPGAHLKVIPGMGHDLPPPLFDTVAEAIVANMQRAARP